MANKAFPLLFDASSQALTMMQSSPIDLHKVLQQKPHVDPLASAMQAMWPHNACAQSVKHRQHAHRAPPVTAQSSGDSPLPSSLSGSASPTSSSYSPGLQMTSSDDEWPKTGVYSTAFSLPAGFWEPPPPTSNNKSFMPPSVPVHRPTDNCCSQHGRMAARQGPARLPIFEQLSSIHGDHQQH